MCIAAVLLAGSAKDPLPDCSRLRIVWCKAMFASRYGKSLLYVMGSVCLLYVSWSTRNTTGKYTKKISVRSTNIVTWVSQSSFVPYFTEHNHWHIYYLIYYVHSPTRARIRPNVKINNTMIMFRTLQYLVTHMWPNGLVHKQGCTLCNEDFSGVHNILWTT